MTKLRIVLIAIIPPLFLVTSSFAQVVVKVKPAKPKTEVVKTKAPGRNHVWVGGHWKWNKRVNKYTWVDARWIKVRKGHAWIPGHWTKVRTGWKYVPAHWARS